MTALLQLLKSKRQWFETDFRVENPIILFETVTRYKNKQHSRQVNFAQSNNAFLCIDCTNVSNPSNRLDSFLFHASRTFISR